MKLGELNVFERIDSSELPLFQKLCKNSFSEWKKRIGSLVFVLLSDWVLTCEIKSLPHKQIIPWSQKCTHQKSQQKPTKKFLFFKTQYYIADLTFIQQNKKKPKWSNCTHLIWSHLLTAPFEETTYNPKGVFKTTELINIIALFK